MFLTLKWPTLLFLLSSTTLLLHASSMTEVVFQDVSEYAIANQTTPHCVTECAITPSDAFKTKYNCDPVNAVNCICGNKTRSVELRSSISEHCYNKCAWQLVPIATAILAGYCFTNAAGVTMLPTDSMSTQPSPGGGVTPPATSTATGTPVPTTPPKASGEDNKITIIASVISSVIGVAAIGVAIFFGRRQMWVQHTRQFIHVYMAPSSLAEQHRLRRTNAIE